MAKLAHGHSLQPGLQTSRLERADRTFVGSLGEGEQDIAVFTERQCKGCARDRHSPSPWPRPPPTTSTTCCCNAASLFNGTVEAYRAQSESIYGLRYVLALHAETALAPTNDSVYPLAASRNLLRMHAVVLIVRQCWSTVSWPRQIWIFRIPSR